MRVRQRDLKEKWFTDVIAQDSSISIFLLPNPWLKTIQLIKKEDETREIFVILIKKKLKIIKSCCWESLIEFSNFRHVPSWSKSKDEREKSQEQFTLSCSLQAKEKYEQENKHHLSEFSLCTGGVFNLFSASNSFYSTELFTVSCRMHVRKDNELAQLLDRGNRLSSNWQRFTLSNNSTQIQ